MSPTVIRGMGLLCAKYLLINVYRSGFWIYLAQPFVVFILFRQEGLKTPLITHS